ncbi:MAG TPA: FtsX-like permease family protein, partial [Opitutaceae bacterium]|nr:FtsX-like permease family protein [Opitutaceae bacterium]
AGNLSGADYDQIKKHPAVKTAIPLALGDNYQGYRVVGTVEELFTSVEYAKGKKYALESGGRWFSGSARDAVIGSFAASKLKLKTGDTFRPYHGLVFDPNNQHEEVYTIVGVLAPTNTPADKVIWIPLSGIQNMKGHDPRTATDVSAVLIQLRAPTAGFMLDMMYNKQGNRLTFAYPIAAIISDLFGKIGWFDRVLALVAYLVGVVAAASVLASIYASMSARRRDLAILRALGAKRSTIFSAVVGEAAAIGALGAVLGFAFYFGLLTAVAGIIRAQTGVVIDVTAYHDILWIAPAAMIGLCALGGVVPAVKAYRVPVAETLTPTS